MKISAYDEIASIRATLRAFNKLVKRHKLSKEFKKLHKRYLPEELQRRREWSEKVKVTTEDK